MLRIFSLTVLGCLLLASATFATAQNREVPYWASLKFDRVFMRVGPSQDYKIKWVYQRKGLPVKVVRIVDGWRLVQDPDGAQGWIASSQLVLPRGALVTGEGLTELRAEPSGSAAIKWRLEPGVVGRLGDCEQGYCELDVQGRKGWVHAKRIWGEGAP